MTIVVGGSHGGLLSIARRHWGRTGLVADLLLLCGQMKCRFFTRDVKWKTFFSECGVLNDTFSCVVFKIGLCFGRKFWIIQRRNEVEGFFKFLPSSWPSAKFVACLPSLVQSVQSFCKVCGNELAKNCQCKTVAHTHDVICGFCTEFLQVGNFSPMVLCWQKAQNLAEKPWTWQEKTKKAEMGEAL